MSDYSHINVSDPIIKLAVSECILNGYNAEEQLCRQLCKFAGNSGIEILHTQNPGTCPTPCEIMNTVPVSK
jgi:hypothetical protein